MRYNSPELLDAWKQDGSWPAIHDAIAEMAVSYLMGSRLVDLGCSYGLLGARIVREARLDAGMGIDASSDAVAAGMAARVPLELKCLRVNRHTMEELVQTLRSFQANILVARRVLPELFADDMDLGRDFGRELRRAGVKEVLLQGRVETAASSNPLRGIAQEIHLLENAYECIAVRGPVAYMRVRPEA